MVSFNERGGVEGKMREYGGAVAVEKREEIKIRNRNVV